MIAQNGKRCSLVLTDFGSAGPLTVPPKAWADIIHVTKDAEQITTSAYRAPKLFGATRRLIQPSPPL